MVAIRDLLGTRSPAFGRLRIGPSTVATDDLHASMRAEPAHNGVGFPIRQDLDRTMGLQIDQQCPVAVAFFPGKIVESQHLRGLALWDLGAADEPRASYRDWSASPGAWPTAHLLCHLSRRRPR